jgi:16S rRNA processing protein RimM
MGDTEGAASPALLEVGQVVRPHGLSGQVVVQLWTNRTERLAPASRLSTAVGELQVEGATRLPEGSGKERWLVSFAGVTDRESAEALRGVVMRAEPVEVQGALWVHEMIGSEVQDEHGAPIGVVESIEANPASDLLVLTDGQLIPLHFVTAQESGRLTVSLPPGLLDL